MRSLGQIGIGVGRRIARIARRGDSLVFGGPLLAGHSGAPPALRTTVCASSLTPNRQTAPVAQAAIRLYVDEAADVHLRLAAKVALDQNAGTAYGAAYSRQVLFVQFPHAGVVSESYLVDKSLRDRGPNTVDRRQGHFEATVVRNVNSRDQCHGVYLTLPLLMLRVRAQDPYHVTASDHLATGAYGLY